MPTRLTWSRLLLAALVAVAAPPACGSKESSGPAVTPGAAAGNVLEVSGAVTATRGDAAPRPLAVGDTVSGDDVIETGADGSIVIELMHNKARWSLGASRKQQVATSAAWKAAPRSGDEVGGTGRSTAAGRHAEREGADTAAGAVATDTAAPTAATPTREPAAAPAEVEAARAAAEEQEREEATMKKDRRTGTSRSTGGGATAKVDVQDPLADVDESPPKPADAPPPTPPPPPPPKGRSAGIWAGTVPGKVSVSGALDADVATKTVFAKKDAYFSCWDKTRAKGPGQASIDVTLEVSADGAVTKAVATGDAKAKSCIETALKRLTFPKADAASTLTTTLTFTTDN